MESADKPVAESAAVTEVNETFQAQAPEVPTSPEPRNVVADEPSPSTMIAEAKEAIGRELHGLATEEKHGVLGEAQQTLDVAQQALDELKREHGVLPTAPPGTHYELVPDAAPPKPPLHQLTANGRGYIVKALDFAARRDGVAGELLDQMTRDLRVALGEAVPL